jgi:hypothetical protein
VADYRAPDPQQAVLLLGPKFPPNYQAPHLLENLDLTAVSFGKDFAVRLPVTPEQWTEKEPPSDCNCLLSTDEGIYFRANGSPTPSQGFVRCFVDANSGVVVVDASMSPPGRFVTPPGIPAYAITWEIVTTEPEPRTILKYPFASA